MPHHSLTVLEGDSSINLYIAQQANDGLMPYANAWEDKPPLVFWLDAISLRFTPDSARGIVYVGYVFVLAFFIAAWATLRPRVGTYPALFALLLCLNVMPDVMLVPNITEVFSLPLQAASFLLLCREAEAGPRWHYPALQGLLGAGLFQLRPNNTAVIGLYLLVILVEHIRGRQVKRIAGSLAVFVAAFAAGNAVVLWPLIARGDLRPYWDAAFGYTRQYSAMRPAVMHLYAIAVGFLKLSRFGGILIVGTAAAVVIAARPSWRNVTDRFAILALTFLLMEVAGSGVSGRAFEHYFIMWLLPATLLAGLFVERCGAAIGDRPFAVAAFCGCCATLIGGSVLDSARATGEAVTKYQDTQANLVRYVRERTTPADSVFAWNGFGDLMFRVGRRPANRFFHAAGMLDERSYRNQATEALSDVARVGPKFILEYQHEQGSVPALFATGPGTPENDKRDVALGTTDSWDTAALRAIKSRLRSRYHLAYSDGSGVAVYELN